MTRDEAAHLSESFSLSLLEGVKEQRAWMLSIFPFNDHRLVLDLRAAFKILWTTWSFSVLWTLSQPEAPSQVLGVEQRFPSGSFHCARRASQERLDPGAPYSSLNPP